MSTSMTNCMRKLMTGLMMPPSGMVKEASGVAHTTGRGRNGYEQGHPEGYPPDVQAQTVQAKRLPALLGVAIPGDHKQHDQGRHGRSERPYGAHDEALGKLEEPDQQGRPYGQAKHKDREDRSLVGIG